MSRASRLLYSLKLVPSWLAGLVWSLLTESERNFVGLSNILFRGQLAGHSSHGIDSDHLGLAANDMQVLHFPLPTLR